jgi:hypothetical protein
VSTNLPIRDIHLPEDISWWPLAPGWWLLFLIGLFLVILMYQRFKRQKNKTTLTVGSIHNQSNDQQIINDAFDILNEISQLSDKQQIIKEVSVLLRRTAMSLYEDDKIAGLTTHNWLTYLDNKGNTTDFSEGIGQVLIEQPYQKHTHYQKDELISLIIRWLSKQLHSTKSTQHTTTSQQSGGDYV